MGIPNFNNYFKKKFNTCIKTFQETDVYKNHHILIIELNGIFYYHSKKMLLENNVANHIILFEKICEEIATIIRDYCPKDVVYLVVDGFATYMKYQEQCKRRFKHSLTQRNKNLDMNSFTPGTLLLHDLTSYIDWFLKKSISEQRLPTNLFYYFANEKVRGEGEIKILDFILNNSEFDTKGKTIHIYSSDSDWILLALLLCEENRKIQLIRKDSYININTFKEELRKLYCFDYENNNNFIYDIYLIFLFFGNDLIQQHSQISSLDDDISQLLKIYNSNGKLLTKVDDEKLKIDMENFIAFLKIVNQKWIRKGNYQMNKLDNVENTEKVVMDYLYNLHNILSMIHLDNDLDWFFKYEYNVTPNFTEIISFSNNFIDRKKVYNQEEKICLGDVYYRLLCTLPETSIDLLPKPLRTISNSIPTFFPKYITIDLRNHNDISIRPERDIYKEDILLFYREQKKKFSSFDKKRNKDENCILYRYNMNKNKKKFLKSSYGSFLKNYETHNVKFGL